MKVKTLIFSFAALLLASCHNEPSSPTTNQENSDEAISEDDYVYAKIEVGLSSGSVGSRAEDDDYDLGLDSENEIKNAILLLFDYDDNATNTATDETTRYFKKAFNLDLVEFTHSDSPSSVQTIKLLKNYILTDYVTLGLIIANHNGLFEVTADNGLIFNSEVVTEGTSLAALKDACIVTSRDRFTNNGILMTNTLGLDVEPGHKILKEHLFTATPFDKKNIYPSESEAINGSPAFIAYLERAVAKVCVKNSSTSNIVSVNGSVKDDLTYEILGWKLINQRQSSYIMRQYEDQTSLTDDYNWGLYTTNKEPKYRFIKSTGKKMALEFKYNLPEFSMCHGFNAGLSDPYNPTSFGNCGDSYPQYCYENTFPVDKMMLKNATCALIKVQFKKENNSVDIFRIGEDYANYYYDNIENEIKSRILANYNTNSVFPDEEGTLSCSEIEINNEEGGYVPIVRVTFTLTKSGSTTESVTWTTTNHETELADLNSKIKLYYYLGGVAYYLVPIKHFGNDLTPWNDGETPTPEIGMTIEAAYHIDEAGLQSKKNYLGRYGVVRNCSYEINISGIKQLGMANDCSISTSYLENPYIGNDETPIDYLESFMKAEVSLLSWTKKSETVELK